MRGSLLLLGLCGLLAAPAAHAQAGPHARSHTSGFHLGLAVNGTAVQLDGTPVQLDGDQKSDTGVGGSLRLGWGINNALMIFLETAGASVQTGVGDAYGFSHFDLGMRLNLLGSYSPLRPYVQGALTARTYTVPLGGIYGNLDVAGVGPSVGAGVQLFATRTIALDAGANYTIGRFTQGRVDNGDWHDLGVDAFSTHSARVSLGLSFYP